MANQRYKSVRDRCLDAVQARLETITQENGYNTNVNLVERRKTVPVNHNAPPQIYIMISKSHTRYRSTHFLYKSVPIELWFAINSNNNEDMEYNLMLADIERAFNDENPLFDDTHALPSKPEIYMVEEEDVPLYSAVDDGNVLGMKKYSMEFWYNIKDPRLWDDCDALVPVDE